MPLQGGVDLSTPAPLSKPGTLRECLNYEVATRDGYTRILGVERFDGGPGVAQFKIAQFGISAPVGTFVLDEPLTYDGHAGYAIHVTESAGITYITAAMEGGSYTLVSGETLAGATSGATGAVITARIVTNPRGTQRSLQSALAALAATRRAQKLPVPGRAESDVLAAFMLRGAVYAVRDLPRIYFENGYYTDDNEGEYLTLEDGDHQILDVRITGDRTGYVIYDPETGTGPIAVPIGAPTLSTLPVSGSIDAGFRTIPYSDGLSVSGGLPPYTWVLAEDDTGPPPPPEIDDLSKVRFLSEQTPAALWVAESTGGWVRVPGGREMPFSGGTALAEISTRALNTDASEVLTTAWKAPGFAQINGVNAPNIVADDGVTSSMGDASGSTLLVRDFGFDALVPAGAKILGVELEIERWAAAADVMQDLACTLIGIIGQPENKSRGRIPISSGTILVTYGGAEDVWGIENIVRDDIADTGFGFTWSIDRIAEATGSVVSVDFVRARVHYALSGGMPAYVWNTISDVPITINLSQPVSGAADTSTLTGYMQISAAVNSDKPRLIDVGDQIRTGPNGTGDLIALVAGRDRPQFLPGQLELDNNRSRYEMIQANFYGQDKFDAIYGVTGAGPAFCFDGANIIKIRSPLSPQDDLPRHIAKHGISLGLGYFGGALLLTTPGNPFEVRGEKGATALEVGDRIMALTPMSGDALGILCQSMSVLLRGLTQLSYFQSTLSARRGAIEYTSADMGSVVVADSFGLFLADAPETYAPAERNYLSVRVESWLRDRLQALANTEQRFLRPVAALAVRAKNQYRLFFRDGYILTLTQKTETEFTMQRYYAPRPDDFSSDTPWAPRALASGIDASGRERLFCSFAGIKAGYLYEIEGGNTFDGDSIPHFVSFNPVTPKGGSSITRYDRIFLYGAGQGYAPISLRRSVDYAGNAAGDSVATLLGREEATATLTVQPIKGEIDFPIEGEELSLRFHGVSGEDAPHTLQYLEMFSDERGPSRGYRGE